MGQNKPLRLIETDSSESMRRPFQIETSRLNLQRLRMSAVGLIVFQCFLLILFYHYKNGQQSGILELLYQWLFFSMLILSFAVLVYCSALGRRIEKNAGRIRVVTTLYAFTGICWGAAVSVLDQYSYGTVTVYMGVVLFIAALLYMTPQSLLAVFLPPHLAFIAAMFLVQDSPELRYTNIVISSIVIVVLILIARQNYDRRLESFQNRALIVEKNSELARINRELNNLNAELEQRSVTDALTGLYNRRMFEETMKKEWERCKRYSITLSVIMMDVDHFKPYNDFYGHQTGDQCLQQIGALLMRTLRFASDIVARYGGEEFIVVLPYTDNAKAAALAERIRCEVERLEIRHEVSKVSNYVTVSLGVATTVPAEENSAEDLVYAADMALYEAKEQNRNRIVAVTL